MKKSIFLLVAAGMFGFSCSNDDSSAENNPTPPVGEATYFPQENGKYWVYDVNSNESAGRDSVYVDNDTVIQNSNSKVFRSENVPNGFFAGALSGNAVRQNGTKLELTGNASFSFAEGFPIELGVSDFVFFDSNASANTQLDSQSGSYELPTEDGYTIRFDYTIKSTATGNSDSYTVASTGESYTDIKSMRLDINLTVTGLYELFGTEIPFEILADQQVLTSTQYYANGIGIVHVSTDIEYQLNDLSAFNLELPIPESGSDHQDEVLDSYAQ